MHSRSVLSVNSQYLVKSIDPPPLLSLSPSLFLSPLFPLLFLFFKRRSCISLVYFDCLSSDWCCLRDVKFSDILGTAEPPRVMFV